MKRLKLSPDVLALNPGVSQSIAIAADKRDARQARTPRAVAQERDGLSSLITAGWSVQSPDCVQYRLYIPGGPDTGLCESAAAACKKAKELTKENG